jgi:response regulator RpfG family c-di-GMP phosphodiesterase/tRNA A-37 threonylcarbamoyl transferase component Bud32
MDSNKTVTTVHRFAGTDTSAGKALTPGRILLQALIESGVILLEEWQGLDEIVRHRLLDASKREELLPMLVEAKLLTDHQAARVLGGGMHQLVLGNYRILDRIGVGGMGVVYRGEHMLMRRAVAIKVLHTPRDADEILLKRFFVEMRVLAKIRHPNIVAALDAGHRKAAEHETHQLHYLVMKYITGTNLEELVAREPLTVARACELVYQIAGALDETHRCQLIHRDIKPSNILVTPDNVAKLLDFGLALHFGRRLTNPGTLLGTLSYMAPEQAVDSANVDIRADIFGLGATLFFCLTGKPPFASQGSVTQQVASRLIQPAPELHALRAEVPAELDKVIRRMMAHDCDERLPTPQAVMRALLPFVNPSRPFGVDRRPSDSVIIMPAEAGGPQLTASTPRLLIVDDEQLVRRMYLSFVRAENFECHEASNGEEALRLLNERPFDLVLLDIDMPKLSGTEVLRRLRAQPPFNNLKIIMVSGGVSPDELSAMLALGADDYLAKPLSRAELVARLKTALLHKATQDRSEQLNQQMLRVNAELEAALLARSSDQGHARNALVFALAKIVESRAQETTAHLTRVTRYVTTLARRARHAPRLAAALDQPFLQILESCTLLHDIGNVALPDHILRCNGKLDAEDIIIAQAHTTIGAETLKSVAKRDKSAAAFWHMASDIARHHHEHFDGTGYPDRLAGNDIPLAARLAALADTYDSLRAPGARGIALSHNAAVEMIVKGSRGRFDPLLVQAFQEGEADFDNVFRACPDGEHSALAQRALGEIPGSGRSER